MTMQMIARPDADRRQGYKQLATKAIWLTRCERCGCRSERVPHPRCCNRMVKADGVRRICRGSLTLLKVVRFTNADGRTIDGPGGRAEEAGHE